KLSPVALMVLPSYGGRVSSRQPPLKPPPIKRGFLRFDIFLGKNKTETIDSDRFVDVNRPTAEDTFRSLLMRFLAFSYNLQITASRPRLRPLSFNSANISFVRALKSSS